MCYFLPLAPKQFEHGLFPLHKHISTTCCFRLFASKHLQHQEGFDYFAATAAVCSFNVTRLHPIVATNSKGCDRHQMRLDTFTLAIYFVSDRRAPKLILACISVIMLPFLLISSLENANKCRGQCNAACLSLQWLL